MSGTESFLDILDRLRAGDPAAADRMIADYTRRLMGLARQRLQSRLGSKVGPEDIVQSVFATFFHHLPEGRWQIEGHHDLWKLLAQITAHKCNRKVRAFHAPSRDYSREQLICNADDDPAGGPNPADTAPTPEEAATFTDLLEHLFASCTSDEQSILRMRLDGHEIHEIADASRLSERTVFRKLAVLRQRLTRLRGSDESTPSRDS